MIVPDRIMQNEGTITVAPGVAGPRILLEDDRRHVELLQTRAERHAALAAADNDAIRLLFIAERRLLGLFCFEPGLVAAINAMRDAVRPPEAFALLEAFELVQDGQQSPCLAVAQAQDAAAAAGPGLETEPGFANAVAPFGLFRQPPIARRDRIEIGAQHRGDRRTPLQRFDVPGEGDEIAPKAFLAEQRARGLAVARGQRILKG